jgi:hypothetical protein
MRIFSLALALSLAGCGGSNAVPEKAEGDEMIACAVDGGGDPKPVCAVERAAGPDGLILTIHHPGGGFRRLEITGDGRGVLVADGAEAAVVTPLGADLIEVAIGADRYHLPATVKK